MTSTEPGKRRTTAAETSTEGKDAAGRAGEAVVNTAATAGRVVSSPLAVTNEVVQGLADTARRPDAVLYWGGLAGAVVLGALEWPVAVAIGVGVVIARGRSSRGSSDIPADTPAAGPAE